MSWRVSWCLTFGNSPRRNLARAESVWGGMLFLNLEYTAPYLMGICVMPSLRRPLHRRKGLLFHRLTPPIPIAGLNYFEALADPPSTPSRAGIALPVLATPSSSKRKRNSVESRTKRKKKFRPSRFDLGPVDAGQTEEADSPTNLDGTDGISQLSPSSPASVGDESLLLASQGPQGSSLKHCMRVC